MDTPPAFPSAPPPLPPRRTSNKWAVWVVVTLLVAGFVFLIVVPGIKGFQRGYIRAQEKRQALREVEGAIEDAKSKMREAFDEETGFSAEKGAEAAEQLKQQLAKASEHLSGDDALAARATQNWLSVFQEKGAAYNALLKEIEIDKLLDLSAVDRAILAQRRKDVERMLAANIELSETIRNAEKDFEAELVKLNVSSKARVEVMKGFRSGARRKHDLLLKVRSTDQTLGEASIELFNLMDREWGKWEFDKTESLVRFESDESIKAYQEIMGRIQKASEDQLDAQRQLVQ